MPTVLLVDEDTDHRQLLHLWLSDIGHQVHTAGSALEALHVLDEHGAPDLAILDVAMEAISGLQLLQHLRQHKPACAQMPAILLTTRHLISDLEASWALNAALMRKPVEEAGLAAAIERALLRAGA